MKSPLKKIVFAIVAVALFAGAAHFVIGATGDNATASKEIKQLDAAIRNKRAELDALKKKQASYKAEL